MVGALNSNKDMFNRIINIFPDRARRLTEQYFYSTVSIYAGVHFHLLSVCVLSHRGHTVRCSRVLDLDEVPYSPPDSFPHLCNEVLGGEMT